MSKAVERDSKMLDAGASRSKTSREFDEERGFSERMTDSDSKWACWQEE